MKFSSTLQFNAVPEWRSEYIDYESLKKLTYNLEKASLTRPGGEESAALITSDPEPVFVKALDRELKKIDSFYQKTEAQLFERDDLLLHKFHQFEAAAQQGIVRQDGASESSDDEAANASTAGPSTAAQVVPPSPGRRRRSSSVSMPQETTYQRITLKREIVSAFVSLSELESYVDLNRTGFRKALKKFDKTLGTSLLQTYTRDTLEQSYVFGQLSHEQLGARIDRLVEEYADLLYDGDTDAALSALKGYLREHVVWERNTVWRDMIGMERRSQGVSAPQNKEVVPKTTVSVFGVHIPRILVQPAPFRLIGIFAVFLLIVGIQPLESRPQSNCLAVVITASLLWATESLPLFVTSLLVPLLIVVLRVPVNKHGHPLEAKDAAAFVFAKMWSPVITVLLGGFTLAAALSKYNIAKAMATMILSRAGSNPRIIVLVLMFVAAFMCMWISNVAAPVLLFSVAQPLLRTLPTGDGFGKAIILGIALASNIGGMMSPIASPQNIIALQNMTPEPSWGEWFLVVLPVAIIGIILVWLLLIVTFPPSSETTTMGHIRGTSDKFTFVHYYILAVTFLTIVLWCLAHQLEPYFGDMGILALVPIVLLFGPGILSGADFNNFLWTIIALAMGGVAMGKAVESCGLLATAATHIEVQIRDLSLFSICLVFGFMILVVATFISHTVAALIVLPLVKSIGEQMEDPHPRVLVMIAALLCSGAMGLPTSGFPNVTAICMTDELGNPYLTVSDFITRGVPSSVIVYGVVILVGYPLSRWVGF